mgnify:CR=1 FL=1
MMKIADANLKSIIFDLGGVILNIDYQKTISAFQKMGISNFENLYTQAQQNHIFDKFEMGLITAQEFRNYIKLESGINITDNQIDMAWNAMLLDLPSKRIDLLNELSQKYKIFLFSNTNQIHLNAFRKSIGKVHNNPLLLEDIFIRTYYSHELKMRKPNSNGFEHILKTQNLQPTTTLFIDDSEQHIKGAQKLGLQTYWLKAKDITELF